MTPAPAVPLVHEWWGLNDQIKSVAAALARKGLVALAVDLYDGGVAEALMGAIDTAEATDTLACWIAWRAADGRTTGRVGAIGWCFGGGWSLTVHWYEAGHAFANPTRARYDAEDAALSW